MRDVRGKWSIDRAKIIAALAWPHPLTHGLSCASALGYGHDVVCGTYQFHVGGYVLFGANTNIHRAATHNVFIPFIIVLWTLVTDPTS